MFSHLFGYMEWKYGGQSMNLRASKPVICTMLLIYVSKTPVLSLYFLECTSILGICNCDEKLLLVVLLVLILR